MNENTKKVDKILRELNKGEARPVWRAVRGFNTMLALEPDNVGGFNVNINRGITVKVFYNNTTGEIKTYEVESVT